MKTLNKGKYIFKRRFGSTYLVEMEILEVSKKAYLIRYRSGCEKWIEKFELSGEKWSDYKLYDDLTAYELD